MSIGIKCSDYYAAFERESANAEIRAAHIDETAGLLAPLFKDGTDFYANSEFISAYHEMRDKLFCDTKAQVIDENVRIAQASMNALRSIDRAFFSRCLFDRINEVIKISEESFTEDEEAPKAEGFVAYVPNTATEKAFSRSEKYLPEKKKIVCRDFKDICESLNSKECEFGILPVENSKEGELIGFTSMISEYGLKKRLLLNIETAEEEYTRFALVSRGLFPPICAENEMFAEFMFSFGSDDGLEALTVPLGLYGASVRRIKNLNESYHVRDDKRFFITLCIHREELCALLFWLSLEFPNFIPCGFYGEGT